MKINEMKKRDFALYAVKGPGCWEWAHTKHQQGYGIMVINRKKVYAHRVAYTIHKGEIPEGMVVRHTCDNTGCVNPDHLILGTQAENMRDAVARNRLATLENGRHKCAQPNFLRDKP